MNPFDAPPSTPAVSYEPPRSPKRRRGRMIGAAVVGAGLVGAGAIGVSALVSADDPELGTITTPTTAAQSDDVPVPSATELDDGTVREFQECLGLPEIRAELPPLDEFDLGELPALDELLGEDFSLDQLLGEDFSLEELFGEWEGELPPLEELFGEWEGELPPLEELFGEWEGDVPPLEELFGEWEGGDVGATLDGLVAVMGPEGPIVVDLGDGDGSVTIERNGDSGEVSVTTDGGAVVVELDGLVEDMIVPLLPDEVQRCVDGLGEG